MAGLSLTAMVFPLKNHQTSTLTKAILWQRQWLRLAMEISAPCSITMRVTTPQTTWHWFFSCNWWPSSHSLWSKIDFSVSNSISSSKKWFLALLEKQSSSYRVLIKFSVTSGRTKNYTCPNMLSHLNANKLTTFYTKRWFKLLRSLPSTPATTPSLNSHFTVRCPLIYKIS